MLLSYRCTLFAYISQTRVCSLPFLLFVFLFSEIASAGFQFTEVTTSAGIQHTSPSFGASWGDFNGDSFPDIWVSNHYSKPSLYLNNGDGTFSDIIDSVWLQNNIVFQADTHGAAWADFDNDGDQDLIEYAGGNGGGPINPGQYNHMFINENGTLTDKAVELGLAQPETRSRTPTWFDWNNDGLLDVVLTAWLRPDGQGGPGIFTQTDDGLFVRDDITTGVDIVDHTIFSHLTDVTGDGQLDLIFHANQYPLKLYDYSTVPFLDLTQQMVTSRIFVSDVSAKDFLGNGKTELFLARRGDPSGVIQTDTNNIKGRLRISGSEHGIRFGATADSLVTFSLFLEWIGIDQIYIGSTGYQPASSIVQLSALETANHGIVPHNAGIDIGVYVGYNPVTEEWELLASNNNINFYVESVQAISSLQEIGFNTDQLPGPTKLWQVNNGIFEDVSSLVGLAEKLPCGRVTSGDFDNDMDIDIYMICTNPYGNAPNVAFENMGNGQFQILTDAAGAIGSDVGRGESVVSADYDLDGFLDLFLVNGEGPEPFHNGPHQLFKNDGNTNNWIQLDIEGVVSNRDGIGARVFVTAGGVTQYREQSGGMHSVSQDSKRIHVGLGTNQNIDSIVIEWPGGIRQELFDLGVNQILKIMEPGLPFAPGAPNYTLGVSRGVFVWKDTFDGPYHLRTMSDGTPQSFEVSLLSTMPLVSTTPIKLEQSDLLTNHPFGFSLQSELGSWQDGLDFVLAPSSRALISVEESNLPILRQLKFGSNTSSLPPSGWIVNTNELPVPPSFTVGQDAGTFVGRRYSDDKLTLRWNGDGNSRYIDTDLISSHNITAVDILSVESEDVLSTGQNNVHATMHVVEGSDGMNVTTSVGALVGIANAQYELFDLRLVNPTGGQLGESNAYWLPMATPFGQPEFDSSNQKGVFIWKDENDIWHLRLSAGGGYQRITGSIVSSQPLLSVAGYRLEENDVLDTSIANQADFDLGAGQAWIDGIDFQVVEGATLSLDIQSATGEPLELLRIGDQMWPVSSLPVDLSGW